MNIVKEITIKSCDWCKTEESVRLGMEAGVITAIHNCERCHKQICIDHTEHIDILVTGWSKYGTLHCNLCPDCKKKLKERWEALKKEFGLVIDQGMDRVE